MSLTVSRGYFNTGGHSKMAVKVTSSQIQAYRCSIHSQRRRIGAAAGENCFLEYLNMLQRTRRSPGAPVNIAFATERIITVFKSLSFNGFAYWRNVP